MMRKQEGFTIIEMLVAMAVMLVVTGAVFGLLSQSQQRNVTTASVQEATSMLRDGVDQMVREIRLAGFPAPNSYPCPPPPGATYATCLTFQNSGYVAGGILLNDPYAIQFEADTDGDNLAEVFDYELQIPTAGAWGGDCAGLPTNADLTSPTLMRSVVVKEADGTVPAPEFQPFVENVLSCLESSPIFTLCPAPLAATPAGCPNISNVRASTLPAPRNTKMVVVRLKAETAVRDPQTGQFHNVELYALAERANPDQ